MLRLLASKATYLAVVATALPYFLFVRGLRQVTAADALATLVLQPLSAAAIGWIVIGERIEGPPRSPLWCCSYPPHFEAFACL